MSIESAVAQLEVEIASFKQGTKDQPKEGSGAWFMLRALSVGLTMLRTMQAKSVSNDPAAAEALFRQFMRDVKASVSDTGKDAV